MWPIDQIAEARITEAMERGDFDDLPGAGMPLELNVDTLVPEELRCAFRLLKNAGYLPPEIQARREIHELTLLISQVDEPEARTQALKKLRLLEVRLQDRRGLQHVHGDIDGYRDKLLGKMS